ncbi:sulfite exporter TauE/SafE family protein [Mesorhizobium sp. CN2-181]|uniref:sulfite exporter TauE/SafE family protein n=1 Tax=Mesorhizobium yinganensis TaxID=3157707 RepID=UPI0032B7DFFC
MTEYLVLAAAAFFAGVLNTIAGGGTFLTFPALVYTGVPLVAANATSAVAVFPGYLGGAIGFRRETRGVRSAASPAHRSLHGDRRTHRLPAPSRLLQRSLRVRRAVPADARDRRIRVRSPRIQGWASRHSFGKAEGPWGTLLVSVYGGYFNGGLGIVLLAFFSLWGMRDINVMNGLKNALSFVLSAISVATFAAAGIVAWPQAALMMAAATMGGYVGAPVARALPAWMVRAGVIAVGVTMSTVFFWRLVA